MKADPNRPRYRTGRSVGRTIYERAGEDWVLVGVMDTVELAAAAVEGLNELTEHADDHYRAQQQPAPAPTLESLDARLRKVELQGRVTRRLAKLPYGDDSPGHPLFNAALERIEREEREKVEQPR